MDGFTQFVEQWAGTVGLDPDLAWRQMRGTPDFDAAKGAHKAKATPQVIGEWLLVAAHKAGLLERR
jgi:hypothetical protein